jgi:hypothetical protein
MTEEETDATETEDHVIAIEVIVLEGEIEAVTAVVTEEQRAATEQAMVKTFQDYLLTAVSLMS